MKRFHGFFHSCSITESLIKRRSAVSYRLLAVSSMNLSTTASNDDLLLSFDNNDAIAANDNGMLIAALMGFSPSMATTLTSSTSPQSMNQTSIATFLEAQHRVSMMRLYQQHQLRMQLEQERRDHTRYENALDRHQNEMHHRENMQAQTEEPACYDRLAKARNETLAAVRDKTVYSLVVIVTERVYIFCIKHYNQGVYKTIAGSFRYVTGGDFSCNKLKTTSVLWRFWYGNNSDMTIDTSSCAPTLVGTALFYMLVTAWALHWNQKYTPAAIQPLMYYMIGFYMLLSAGVATLQSLQAITAIVALVVFLTGLCVLLQESRLANKWKKLENLPAKREVSNQLEWFRTASSWTWTIMLVIVVCDILCGLYL